MGKNSVLRGDRRESKARGLFLGKDDKKPFLQRILLALIVLVILLACFLVYRDIAPYINEGAAVSSQIT